MIRLIYITIILLIPLIAKPQEYCDFIQNVQDYQDSVKLNHVGDYDILDSKTFDVKTYISLFDNIEIEKGYKIDVYYFDNFLDGNPYLYALRDDEELKTKNKKSLYDFLNTTEIRAKSHIFPKDFEKGFLQYLFFCEMGEQFALKWHSNYNEKFIICTKNKLDEVINEFKKYNQPQTGENEAEMPAFQINLEELDKFAQINPEVKIEMTNEFCEVTWHEDRTQSGIYKCKYKIQRQFPYKIEKINEERLLEITIGFRY